MLTVHFAWAFANGTNVAHECVECLAPHLPDGPFKYENGGPERLLGQYGFFSRIAPRNLELESVPILRTVSPWNHELGMAWFYILPGATAVANLSSLKILHVNGFLEVEEYNSIALHNWMVEKGVDALIRTKSKFEVPMQLILLLKNAGALEMPCPDHDAIIDCVDYKNVTIGTTAAIPVLEPMCPTRVKYEKPSMVLVFVLIVLLASALILACYLYRKLRQPSFPSYTKVALEN